MAVIGTFGSYTAARLGIYASQASLNVTGNNIANINTRGYTRQRMDLVSLYSNGSIRYANSFNVNIGYGVLTDGVSQLRDPFLDIRYRDENANVGAYETRLECLQYLSHILDEVGDGNGDFGVLEGQFNDFLQQLQNLNIRVGSVEYDTTVRGSAEIITQLFNSYAEKLEKTQDDQLKTLKEDVGSVNKILTQIRDLNVQIRDAGIYGDKALELRDQRNVLIDDLSAYVKINVHYDMEKIDEFSSVERINIDIADSGTPPIRLVQGIYAGQLDMPEETLARNPEYDPESKKGMQYIGIGTDRNAVPPKIVLTDNPREAIIAPDGTPLENNLTNREALEGAGKVDPDTVYDPAASEGMKYLDAAGNPTDDPAQAATVNNAKEKADDNRLWMQVKALVDEKGRYMRDENGREITEDVDLYDNDLYGSLQARREFLTEEGEFASKDDIAFDKDALKKRGIPYYRKSLDALARKFADIFNEANTGPDGKPILLGYETEIVDGIKQYKTANGCDLGSITDIVNGVDLSKYQKEQKWVDLSSLPPDVQVAIKSVQEKHLASDADVAGALNHGYPITGGGVLFSNSGDGDDPTDITAANISIAKKWSNGEVRILNTKKFDSLNHSTANDNIAHMINLMGTKFDYMPKDTVADADSDKRYFNGTFQERLADINNILAVDQQGTAILYNGYTKNALSLENSRQSVAGVDLNDEATSMMQFQKSYSAACQLMTTLDAMLEKLINGTIR